jgi:hypothetical protein
LVLWAPLTLVAIVLSQEPWMAGVDESRIVKERVIGEERFVVTQSNDGLGECITQFWHRDRAGKWSGYMIDYDAVLWRTAGIRKVSSSRVDVTRWGLIVASFDPQGRQLCRISDGSVRDTFSPSGGHP